jgi:hypothetical protein
MIIMTRVNLLLPAFELALPTNNAEVLTQAIQLRYPQLPIHSIFWIESAQQSQDRQFECAVRVEGLDINFDQMLEAVARVRSLESTVTRLKGDLFNFVGQYEVLQAERNSFLAKMEKYKEEVRESFEDASVSLKLEDKIRKSPNSGREDSEDSELASAVFELTR